VNNELKGIQNKEIILFDLNSDICDAWREVFEDVDCIQICNCDLSELPDVNCIVTAGNSFGAMSGGIDLAVRDMFGQELQDIIQLEIMKYHPHGMDVGTVLTVKLETVNIMYAPTMRVPQFARPLDIAYVMSVIIKVFIDFDWESIAICGLGSGTGQLVPSICASMMYTGYNTAIKLLEDEMNMVEEVEGEVE